MVPNTIDFPIYNDIKGFQIIQGEQDLFSFPGFPSIDVFAHLDPASALQFDGSILRVYRRTGQVERCVSQRQLWVSNPGRPIATDFPRFQSCIACLRGPATGWRLTIQGPDTFLGGSSLGVQFSYCASEMGDPQLEAEDDRPYTWPLWVPYQALNLGAGAQLVDPQTVMLRQLYAMYAGAFTSAMYFQVFDSVDGTDVPDGTFAKWEWPITATNTGPSWDFRDVHRKGRANDGLMFVNGIWAKLSSTPHQLTSLGVAATMGVGLEIRGFDLSMFV